VNQQGREYFLSEIRRNLLSANTEILFAGSIDTNGEPMEARSALANIRAHIGIAITYVKTADEMARVYRTWLEESDGD
jgi:hypothetical protein